MALRSFNRSVMLQFPARNLSWHWYQTFLGDPRWLAAFVHSVGIGAVVASCAVMLGTLAPFGLQRSIAGPGALPSPLPTVIIGIGLFSLLSLLHLTDTWFAIIAGHVVLTVPYGIVVVSAALERLDAGLTRTQVG